MTGELIDLNRRFRPATEDDGRRFHGLFGHDKLSSTWPDLLAKRRVVILAEAGSGKSTEFERQQAAVASEGRFSFIVTVRDVADAGLEGAMPPEMRLAFGEWRASPDAECWLFVDSVDEAKDQGHHFDGAARRLADAVAGLEERVHLYISGRFTDWDKTGDQRSMDKWLRLPKLPPPPTDLGDEVRATLDRKERKPQGEVEPIEILRMDPLAAWQVRKFAEGVGIADVDALLKAIEHGNLWSFAARPLDLGWMVDFWRAHKRLGTLREMIEKSIKARLLDPDPMRRRNDPIGGETGRRALDRIGAGFLFCGKDTLRIPTAGLDPAPAETSIPLEDLLPDWSDEHRLHLLRRPVFDPATLGRARLHNDNEQTLRTYLTATWLQRRIDDGCPLSTVFDLLFVDLYGYRLVRPDMVDASAWLSGTSPAVAEAVISRSPFNLLKHGDPSSLPIPTRVKALDAALGQLATIDRQKLWFIEDSLRRFADPALNPHFADWWLKAGSDEEARHIVLRLIHVGRQAGGLETVRAVAFDQSADEISQLLAGRGLIAIGDDEDRRRYARYVVSEHAGLRRSIILETLSELFPTFISVDEFFALIDAVGVSDDDGHQSILPLGPELPVNLVSPADLEALLDQIVARSGEFTGEGEEHQFREAFAKLASAAAIRLLNGHPDVVPNVVTDLVLLLRETELYSGSNDAFQALGKLFGKSRGRRQSSFWRAVDRIRSHPYITDPDDVDLFMVQHLGWPVVLTADDLAWLVPDLQGRTDPRDRQTALRTAHALWREFGQDPAIFASMVAAVEDDPRLAEQLTAWQTPQPETPEKTGHMARMEELREHNSKRTAERDTGWIELIETLRADTTFFDRLSPQTADSVDSRLFHLWQFLSWRTQSRSVYAIESLDVVAPIFGPELTRRFGEALIAFAYAHTPQGATEQEGGARSVTNFDTMALGGMALAARTIPNWATTISPERADQAAHLAIIELNGLPAYLISLAEAHPDRVRPVLRTAIERQLDRADPQGHGMLDRLEYADPAFARLMAPDLLSYLETHPSISAEMLEKAISVIIRALPHVPDGLAAFVAERVDSASDPVIAAYYLFLLFGILGDPAVDALERKMLPLGPADQASLCCTLLPRLFGGRFHRSIEVPVALSVQRLEQLLVLAFEGVRPDEDINRPSGKVYSPELRDEAQDARNSIFNRLLQTPGEATHAALLRLATISSFHIEPEWLHVHAYRRAEGDACLPAWMASDLLVFERKFDRPPTTTADLQFIAQRRLEGIQHDLINHKFAQGDTVQSLVDENAVQRWVATALEARQEEAYTVHREIHYVEEKEPDIVLASRHSGVELPIEIKVADGLSVAQMEAALATQLCGQYLRHDTTRHGILLLVYQNARRDGWELTPGAPKVPFDNVLARLNEKARLIREASALGPQPIVATIDVSKVVPIKVQRDQARVKAAARRDASEPNRKSASTKKRSGSK